MKDETEEKDATKSKGIDRVSVDVEYVLACLVLDINTTSLRAVQTPRSEKTVYNSK